MVTDRPCDGCGTAFGAVGEYRDALLGTQDHRVLVRGCVPTEADRAEFLAVAGEAAKSAGWLVGDTAWRCPPCREKYGDDGVPRRFTIAEAGARRRTTP